MENKSDRAEIFIESIKQDSLDIFFFAMRLFLQKLLQKNLLRVKEALKNIDLFRKNLRNPI